MSEGVGTLTYQTQQVNLLSWNSGSDLRRAKKIQISFVFVLQHVVIRDNTYRTNVTN